MVNKQKVIPVSPQPLVHNVTAAAAKLLQPYPTLCNPIDGSLPGSPVPGILQARTVEWVAISFSNAWKWKVKVKSLSHVRLLVTPWTVAYQAPLSMGFSRQEYWSGLPCLIHIMLLVFFKLYHNDQLIFFSFTRFWSLWEKGLYLTYFCIPEFSTMAMQANWTVIKWTN